MLPYSVEYAPLFEQTPSATPSFSASSTLLKSVDCNSFVVRNIPTLCKTMGGIPPSIPFRNSAPATTAHRILCSGLRIVCALCSELHSSSSAVLTKTAPRTATSVAFRLRRGYRYQVVRTNCYPSRPAMIADAENLAGLLTGAKGHRHTHASFSGGRT